jgi:hypothetical protein
LIVYYSTNVILANPLPFFAISACGVSDTCVTEIVLVDTSLDVSTLYPVICLLNNKELAMYPEPPAPEPPHDAPPP